MSILFRLLYRGGAAAVALLGLAARSPPPPPPPPPPGRPAVVAAAPTATVASTARAPGTGSDVCTRVSTSTVTASFGGSATVFQSTPFLGNPACAYSVKASNLGVDGVIQVANMIIWKAQ